MSYQYAYLVADGLLAITWICFYVARRDLRHQQLLMSILTAPLSLTQIWFYGDYWRPAYVWAMHIHGIPFGVEDILFSFLIGGIGSVLYEVLLRKRHRNGMKRLRATLIIITFAVISFVILKDMGMNTIWASSLPLITASIVVILIDRDLRADWIMSSLLMFVFIVSLYLIWLTLYPHLFSTFWELARLSGKEILGIPVEELSWFVSWAMFSGVIYEFFVNAGPYSPLKAKTTLKHRAKI